MDPKLTKFILFINKFGLEISMFKAWGEKLHPYELDSYDKPMEKYNYKYASTFSVCVNSGETMEYLLSGLYKTPFTKNHIVKPYGIYIGGFDASLIRHYFTVISDCSRAFVINTYGGVPYQIIVEHTIEDINNIIQRVINKDMRAFFDLFGEYPNKYYPYIKLYDNDESIYINLSRIDYILPNKETILKRIKTFADDKIIIPTNEKVPFREIDKINFNDLLERIDKYLTNNSYL